MGGSFPARESACRLELKIIVFVPGTNTGSKSSKASLVRRRIKSRRVLIKYKSFCPSASALNTTSEPLPEKARLRMLLNGGSERDCFRAFLNRITKKHSFLFPE